MRNTPEYFVAPTYEVAAYVMEPPGVPAHAIARGADEVIRRHYWRVHFHMIKERQLPGSCS